MQTIPVKYIDTTNYKIRIYQDEWADGPDTWGNFTIVDFTRDGNANIDDYTTETGKLLPSVQAKLKAGKMFFIDKYEHSGVSYSLSNEGMQCRFDTSSNCGFIVFDDAYIKGISYSDRQEYARRDLEVYNQWANGEVYTVDISTAGGLDIESCSGFIGDDAVKEYIHDVLPNATAENVDIQGQYSDGQLYDVWFTY